MSERQERLRGEFYKYHTCTSMWMVQGSIGKRLLCPLRHPDGSIERSMIQSMLPVTFMDLGARMWIVYGMVRTEQVMRLVFTVLEYQCVLSSDFSMGIMIPD